MNGPLLDERVERALVLAEAAHRGQGRKGRADTPYVLHPIHCAIVLARLGIDAELIVAALLHDVVEDCDGWSVARVEHEFGARVAGVVAALTEDKSKTWEERKRAQVDDVPRLSPDALLVKAADKLHNLRTLALDLGAADDRARVWSRFRGGRERTLRTSRALVDALAPRVGGILGAELEAAMSALERLEGVDPRGASGADR